MRRWRLAALALSVLCAAPGDAFADEAGPSMAAPSDADLARARELFKEGLELEKKGDFASARRVFEQVASVRTTPQVRYHLALCDEQLGRWVRAIEGFRAALREAEASPGPGTQQVVESAPPRIETLEARIPRIEILLEGSIDGIEVLVDREVVSPEALDELWLDPGAHRIAVARGERTLLAEEIVLAEGDRETVRFVVPKASESAESAPRPDRRPTASPPEPGSSKVPAVVAGGVGLAGLAAASVFFGFRQKALGEVLATCDDPDNASGCDPAMQGTADEGRTFTVLSVVFAGVGVAGLGTAALMFLLEDDTGPQQSAIQLRPLGGVSTSSGQVPATGLAIEGRF